MNVDINFLLLLCKYYTTFVKQQSLLTHPEDNESKSGGDTYYFGRKLSSYGLATMIYTGNCERIVCSILGLYLLQ